MVSAKSFSFGLPIWRIMGDTLAAATDPSLLVVELRNREDVVWAGLNTSTQQLIWQHTFEQTDWWTSTIGCYNGTLLLHRYASNEQPAPKGLLAVNAANGHVRWELNQLSFVQTDGSFLQTAQQNAAQMLTYQWHILANGEKLPEMPATWTAPAPDSAWSDSILYPPNNVYYSFLSNFVSKKTGQNPVQTINYAEINACIVLLYYFYPQDSNTLSRSLLILDSKKTVLWHEISSSFGDSTSFGGFIHGQNQVIYLRSELELLVLNF